MGADPRTYPNQLVCSCDLVDARTYVRALFPIHVSKFRTDRLPIFRVDTAFVQLIASCTDEFFKTVVLSALILLLASLACGVLYTWYRDSFAGPEREVEWQKVRALINYFCSNWCGVLADASPVY